MVKIESVTAEIFLIWTNVFRTNVAWTNVTVKLSCGCVGVLTTDKATKAFHSAFRTLLEKSIILFNILSKRGSKKSHQLCSR